MRLWSLSVSAPKRRRAVTRDLLLDSAREVLAAEGIQGATVEHICERAGFTRGAFYSNFDSRDALILAVFEREKTQALGVLHEAFDAELGDDGDMADLLRVLEAFFTGYQHDRTSFLVHSEFVIHAVRDPQIGRMFLDLWGSALQEIGILVERGVSALGRRLTIPVDHAVTLVLGAFEVGLRDDLLATPDGEPSVDRFLEIVPSLLSAISAPS